MTKVWLKTRTMATIGVSLYQMILVSTKKVEFQIHKAYKFDLLTEYQVTQGLIII